MFELADLPPLILFEDEHLLVVNKPAGWNTHAPAPFSGEGVYEWLRNREPRWATLAIIQRLDKETSGVLIFSKTPLANHSLTRQFAERAVGKRYVFVTDQPVERKQFVVKSALIRVADRYVSRPLHAGAQAAETRFRVLEPAEVLTPPLDLQATKQPSEQFLNTEKITFMEAIPLTGRTHQIRVHAAISGCPIRGDVLYGGTPAARLCLHAAELHLRHPVTGEQMKFEAPSVRFDEESCLEIRGAILSPETTNACRLVHGAADWWPGWYVDRLGDFALSQSEVTLSSARLIELQKILERLSLKAAYHKMLLRQIRKTKPEVSCQPVIGPEAPDEFVVRENGVRFALSFLEGYSVGLFLDQRDNRRRFLRNYVAAGFPLFEPGSQGSTVLNTFAYTCGFSVCAAMAGTRVTSLDLSHKHLTWGKRNFALNQLDPAKHDFIHGDAFDWLRRLAKKQRTFDTVIVDPPTFSQSKERGVFQVERDYSRLIQAAVSVLKTNGVLLACTNAASLKPEDFLELLREGIGSCGRTILRQHYAPQPPDFPITREEPGYLKTVWLRVA